MTLTLETPLLIGAHMSVAGGLHTAFARAEQVGCQTMQIFTSNDRQWNAKTLTDEDLESWVAARAISSVGPILSHSSYLVNLASPKDEIWNKSYLTLLEQIERCQALGIQYLVIHPGSHKGSGEAYGLSRVAEILNRAQQETDTSGVMILLETTAGQGASLGYRFEHFNAVFEMLDEPERVGVCFDTCHVFAAGYDFTTPDTYRDTMSEFDRYAGLKNLRAFHINDSRNGLGSRLDRHEGLGKGALGLEPFRFIMNDPRLENIPKALETPKGTDNSADLENMAILRKLVGSFVL